MTVPELDATRVQEAGLNEPPAPPSLHETVPGGDGCEMPLAVTVAVNFAGVLSMADAELGDMVVVVAAGPDGPAT